MLSYTEREWKLAMKEVLRVLKPGGMIELGIYLFIFSFSRFSSLPHNYVIQGKTR